MLVCSLWNVRHKKLNNKPSNMAYEGYFNYISLKFSYDIAKSKMYELHFYFWKLFLFFYKPYFKVKSTIFHFIKFMVTDSFL